MSNYISSQQGKEQNKQDSIFDEPQSQEKQLWELNPINLFKQAKTQYPTIENKKQRKSFFCPGSKNLIYETPKKSKGKDEEKENKKDNSNQLIEEQQQQQQQQEQEQEQEQQQQQQQQLDQNGNDDAVEKQEDEEQGNKKQKDLKKQKIKGDKGNFVKLNLKKIYQDRFRGQLYINKKIYKKNGQLKKPNRTQPEQKKIDFQIMNQQGESQKFNIYIKSLSQGLLVDIYEDDKLEIIEQIELEDQIKELIPKIKETMDDQLFVKLLELVFGYSSFREGQLESIKSILRNESILFIQKTGHGKSLVYQYLSFFLDKQVAIIISPLIALIIDQIAKLNKYISAVGYHSMLTNFQKDNILQMVKNGDVRLMFCTPEIFQSDLAYVLNDIKIGYICIDEAHCVSELSHSFRHTYMILHQIIENFLKLETPPYLALTATATKQTIEQIKKKFKISNTIIEIKTQRPNVHISVSRDRDTNSGLLKLLQSDVYKELQSIIIYCRSRYMVDMVCNFLKNSNFNCSAFHSQLDEQVKIDLLNNFLNSQIRIMVATSIFAMGIDKQDIRAIIHLNMPKSMEAYLQEIGRAGRDGQDAYCHLFLKDSDFHIERSFILADSPEKSVVLKLHDYMLKHYNEENPQINYLICRVLEEQLDVRKQNAYSLILQLEEQSEGRIKAYPMCPEKLILKFYSVKSIDARKESEFLDGLFKLGSTNNRNMNGALQVNVVKCSNELSMNPLEFVKRCRQIAFQFSIKLEAEEEIIPFMIKEKMDHEQLIKVFQQLEMIKQSLLQKLNCIYLTCFENSSHNVNQLRQGKQFFDLYFGSEHQEQAILQEIYGTSDINIDEYLPFDSLDQEQEKQIKQAISRFIQEECANLTQTEIKRKSRLYYKNPNILSRLLCGVQTVKYSYREFKNSSIWNKASRLKYEDVHKIVLGICLSNNNIN